MGVDERNVDRHCDPGRAPRAQLVSVPRAATSGPRRSVPRCSASSRSTPTADRGGRHVRPRRHRHCLRGARRPVPRRRSGRPRAHLVGRSRRSTRVQSARIPPTTPDSVSIDHRPLVTIEAGDMTASIRAVVGPHAGPQHLHRGGASAERIRSGRHPSADGTSPEGFDAEWRMINVFTVEGDLSQPLRNLRRGRPRRRARPL